MVCSDQRGALFLEACRRAGAAVPDEVAVAGVDNDEALCDVCNPPLSSVEAGHELVGFEAAAMLDRLMQGRPAPREPLLIQPRGIAVRSSTEVSAIADRQLAAALRLIREHAATGLKVDQIAREVGLSRSVLQRRFRATLRRSVHGEILNARIRRARELLIGSDLSLAEVAERAGFRHQEYLGAVLKTRLGKTPLEVRRESGRS
jgi:LacI family transcriptional regulator